MGVDYGSDVNKVMDILKTTVQKHPKVLNDLDISVRFDDYADSALIFSVLFWSDEVFRIENIKSQMRVSIFHAFKENNILIPFPQRVIHTSPSKE